MHMILFLTQNLIYFAIISHLLNLKLWEVMALQINTVFCSIRRAESGSSPQN